MFEIYSFVRKLASIIGMNRTTITLVHSMNVIADYINNNTRVSKPKVNKTTKSTNKNSILTDDDIEDIDNSIEYLHYILTDKSIDFRKRIDMKFKTLSLLEERDLVTETGRAISAEQFITNDILDISNKDAYPINIQRQLDIIMKNKDGDKYNNYVNLRNAARRLLKNNIITNKAYYLITEAYKK